MIRLKAYVRSGRLVLDEPTDLPEGTEVELIAANSWNDLDENDRRRLHDALVRSEDDVRLGRVRPAADVIGALRRAGS